VRDSIICCKDVPPAHLRNSVFNNRSRPCLLYQIKRCSGPCVDLIARDDYAQDVQMASMFLQGRQQEVIGRSAKPWIRRRELAFEQAAIYRDQIQSLRQVQDKQYVESSKGEDVDVVVVEEGGMLCVNLAMVRGGRHLGDKAAVSRAMPAIRRRAKCYRLLCSALSRAPDPARIIPQFACWRRRGRRCARRTGRRPVPDGSPADHAQGLGRNGRAERRLAILAARTRLSRQEFALGAPCMKAWSGQRGRQGSAHRVLRHQPYARRVDGRLLRGLSGQRHAQVEYRRFNIKDIQPGDDYAAMRQAVLRRYEKVASGEAWRRPDPDRRRQRAGRHGRVALEELGLSHLPMLGVAKGEGRKPGLET
jgi:excinuclease ABC subunit C